MTPGLSSVEGHPLLSSPALFVINDGPLTPQNEEAIHLVGLSSKSGDGSTIGKFGLAAHLAPAKQLARNELPSLHLPFRRPHLALLGALCPQ